VKKLLIGIVVGCVVFGTLAGCFGGRGHGPVDAFQFLTSKNPSLAQNVTGIMNEQADPVEIVMVVPPDTESLNLVATFSLNTEAVISVVSTGTPVVQQNGVTRNDFSAPILYSVQVPKEKKPWRYRVTVRYAETNAALAQIAIPEGYAMTPLFSPRVKSYTVDVPFSVKKVRIDAKGQSQNLKSISIDGAASGGASASTTVDFSSGASRSVSIETLAEDGATRDGYAVLLKRLPADTNAKLASLEIVDAPLFPGFSPTRAAYQAEVPFDATQVVVKAAAQSKYATITLQTLAVVGRITSGRTALSSRGSPADRAGAAVDFSNGTLLPVIVAVTAEDGGVQEYMVEVKRADPDHNNALAELAVAGSKMSPVFSPRMLTYAVEVPFSTQQLVITAKAQSKYAKMALGPGPAASGAATAALQAKGALDARGGVTVEFPTAERITLAVAVTAQDGKTAQYVLDVRRAPPDGNADLGTLTTAAGVLSPIFSPRIISYAVSLPSSIDSAKLTVSTASPVAAVAVEGSAAKPAAAQTFSVSVAAGATETVNLIVTAEDGTQKMYRVRVSREAAAAGTSPGKDTNARLASLQLVGAQLTPAFNPALLDYEAKLASNVAFVTLTARAESPVAAIAVDGQPLAATGRVIALEAGAAKTVIIAVTAESGNVVQTTLRLGREGSGTQPSTGTDRVSVSLAGVQVAKRELLALAESKGSIGEEARITVRYYRTNTVIAQGTAKVAMKTQGVTPVLTASYLSPGAKLERGRLVEVEVAIPAGGANWLHYTEAQWAAPVVEVDVPFLLFSNNPRAAWPAIGRAVKVTGYVSFSPDGPQKVERQSDAESFDRNEKGEYGVQVTLTSTSGQVLGTDTVWTKPGLPRSHVFPFTKVFTLPEGSTVRYTLTAKAKNGVGWSVGGTAQIWTTNLAYESGFDPVILRITDDLAPAK
jgi:hypothetical protein